MFTRAGLAIVSLIALLGVASCGSDKDPQLMNMSSSNDGPDEFSIQPSKPLETPDNYTELLAPTPGQGNISDPTPRADAIIALGGNPAGGTAGSSALMARASRFGVDPAVRTRLASEDLEWRRRNNGRLLERLLSVNVYFKAYEEMTLDKYSELDRWRAVGADTPAAPPKPVAKTK